MTVFFQYDTLTWPEVAALPIDIPLILPLGEGYSLDQLASALGEPPRVGLLPPFPFGWSGSGLAVPEPILGSYLANLLDSLRDDGFTRSYALTPQGIDLGLGADRIALPQRSEDPKPPDSERNKVILLPIGHIEQHWGAIASLGLLVIIQIVLLAFYMQKYIVRGMTYGAIRE